MSARDQYMKKLQSKVDNANNLSYVTSNYSSYYPNDGDIGTGRANRPSDYQNNFYSSMNSGSSSYSSYSSGKSGKR